MAENPKEKSKVIQDGRVEYIDVLRVLSMLSVVFLHTAAGSLRGNIGSAVWHISNVLTSIMSISVPVFFMISGAMLMSSKKTLSIEFTYKKRISKMFIPFLVWSIAAIAYYQAPNLLHTGTIDWRAVAKKLVIMPSQAAAVHLWFMYALIPLYILSPILKKLVDTMTEDLVKYMLIIWLAFSSFLPTVASLAPVKFQPLLVLDPNYNLNIMNGYLGYFLIGYYLLNYGERISKKLLIGIIAVDTAVISLGSWWKTIETGSYSEIFKVYSRLFILILSIAVFLLAKELMAERRLPRTVSGILQVLSNTSFGVYLLHNLVVDFVSSHEVNLWPAGSIHTLFLSYFVILLISLACIIMLASCKLTCYAFTGMTYENACKTCNIQYFLNRLRRTVPLSLESWR